MRFSAGSVRFGADHMCFALSDGRTPGVAPAWFPHLLAASEADCADVTLSPMGLHREALDEYISVAGRLAVHGDARRGAVAAE